MYRAICDSCYSAQLRELLLNELKELVGQAVISIERQGAREKKNREIIIDFFTGAICELIISYVTQNYDNRYNNISQRISYMMHLFDIAMKEE